MRTRVEFNCGGGVREHEAGIRQRVLAALRGNKLNWSQLASGGMTPEILAYARVSLKELVVERACPLEHVVGALCASLDDLQLLGFKFSDLADKKNYPLIALYDRCGVRALHILSFDIGWGDLQRYVLNTDTRYAKLLDLNLPWWKRAIGGSKGG